MTKKQFGRTCHAGGRRIELVSDHYEWNDWANDWLDRIAYLETTVRLGNNQDISKAVHNVLKASGVNNWISGGDNDRTP